MQVEHKTEKGTIVFVKIPDNAKAWKNESYHVNTLWYKSEDMRSPKHIELPYDDLILIGLTSEVAENEAKMVLPDTEIVGEYDNGLYVEDWYGYIDYVDDDNSFSSPLDSLKSLMQHLQISDSEKWVVLFKPNEK